MDMVTKKVQALATMRDDIDIELDVVCSIFDTIEKGFAEDAASLNNKIDEIKNSCFDIESEVLLIALVQESALLENNIKEMTQSSILMILYHYFENKLKSIVRLVDLPWTIENFNSILDYMLKEEIIASRDELVDYDIVNELRLVNNCLKHNNGKVKANLEKVNSKRWKKDEQIVIDKASVYEYRNSIAWFLGSAIDYVKEHIIFDSQ